MTNTTATSEPTPALGGNAGMSSEYLEVRNLSVSFDGFKAVDGVDLTLMQGDLRFLIGPNGAGKTTLVDAITGLVPATGSITKSGEQLLGKKVHKIARLGVGRTFQTASVFEELSVLQNLDIAAGAGRSAWNLLRRRKGVLPEIEEALETTGLEHLRDTPAGILAHGQKQWLEIGMLLVQNCSVLLLDEPVAGMSLEEREETGNLLRRIGGARTVVRSRARHGLHCDPSPRPSQCSPLGKYSPKELWRRSKPTPRCKRSTSAQPLPEPISAPTPNRPRRTESCSNSSTSAPGYGRNRSDPRRFPCWFPATGLRQSWVTTGAGKTTLATRCRRTDQTHTGKGTSER